MILKIEDFFLQRALKLAVWLFSSVQETFRRLILMSKYQ